MTTFTNEEPKNKKLTTIIYALYALSLVTGGLAAIVAVVINYVKRPDVRGTWLESHFRYQIRTFWFGLIWAVVGLITAIVGVGLVVLIVEGIWVIYRIVKGWLYLNDNKPMYGWVAPVVAALQGGENVV